MRGSPSLALTAPASAAFAAGHPEYGWAPATTFLTTGERRPRDLSCAAEPAS